MKVEREKRRQTRQQDLRGLDPQERDSGGQGWQPAQPQVQGWVAASLCEVTVSQGHRATVPLSTSADRTPRVQGG